MSAELSPKTSPGGHQDLVHQDSLATSNQTHPCTVPAHSKAPCHTSGDTEQQAQLLPAQCCQQDALPTPNAQGRTTAPPQHRDTKALSSCFWVCSCKPSRVLGWHLGTAGGKAAKPHCPQRRTAQALQADMAESSQSS